MTNGFVRVKIRMNKAISRFLILDEVDSTNNYVAKAAVEGRYRPGTAILSYFQTAGRGQRGSTWQADRGANLTFSFAVSADFLPVHRLFMFSKAISVGLCTAVAEMTGGDALIKWPNDILLNGKKTAGILIEFKSLGERMAVVGIGLNVNQTEFGRAFKATSVANELGRRIEIEAAARTVSDHLNTAYEALTSEAFDTITADYNAMLYGYRTAVTFETAYRSFEGTIGEVDESGMLLVRSKQGGAETFAPKEIKIKY